MHSPPRLHTLGYEGLDIGAFVQLLRAHAVQTVVDVRELPLSRKRGFSKSSFRAALADAGLDYRHTPALGCPRPIRNRFRADGDWAAYSRDFRVYLGTQEAALQELVAMSQSRTACLVCFEADYNQCHRSYVARSATALGAPATWHLLANTKTASPDFLQPAAA